MWGPIRNLAKKNPKISLWGISKLKCGDLGKNVGTKKAMAKIKRHKTDYPGVYYIMGKAVATGKPERIYYIRYRKNGKPVEEKAGRQFQDDMTPARASNKRALKIEGEQPSIRKYVRPKKPKKRKRRKGGQSTVCGKSTKKTILD